MSEQLKSLPESVIEALRGRIPTDDQLAKMHISRIQYTSFASGKVMPCPKYAARLSTFLGICVPSGATSCPDACNYQKQVQSGKPAKCYREQRNKKYHESKKQSV